MTDDRTVPLWLAARAMRLMARYGSNRDGNLERIRAVAHDLTLAEKHREVRAELNRRGRR